MLGITAQVSFYPLRQDELSPSIKAATQVFDHHGIERETGPMSTLMWGGDDKIFAALHEAFLRVAAVGEAVMTVTISNACPWPGGKG
ncbi:MAG: YkoF family thiamine/hydroxymethylpyrimidine-binding protein [bacterium]|nr:YkoF family thiamine/hydroxymethylpyrimidine-binding protein [bacterium]